MKRSSVYRLYDSIRLHWGIKRVFESFLVSQETRILNWFVLPVFQITAGLLSKGIIRHYGADYKWDDERSQNLDKKTNNLGYGLFHYALVRNHRPKRILCIGSMYGFIPFMLARACQDNNRGHVDFVDAAYDEHGDKIPTKHFFGQGFWKKINITKHFSYLLNPKYITTYIMTSEDFAKKYSYSYDYIYFDADHTYTGATKDLRLFWARVKTKGFICFHDIEYTKTVGGLKIEFWKVWNKLNQMPYKFELPNGYSGLGFIQNIGNKDLLKMIRDRGHHNLK